MPTSNNIFTLFLKRLKIKHTPYYSDKLYNEHPHKNNLFGLSDMLTVYGIKNFIMISILSLQGATMLNKNEMKSISGGQGDCCAYNTDWTQPGFTCLPHGGPGGAQHMADADGPDTGWWACNSQEVIAACGC